MVRSTRWLLPATAAFGLVFGVAAMSARAQDSGDKAKTGSVSGTVVDKDGKAVADVEVRLMKPFRRGGRGGGGGAAPGANGTLGQPGSGSVGLAQDEKPAPPPPPPGGGRQMPPPVATAKSDKDGKFEMKDVPVGEYMLTVRDDEKKVYGRANVTVEDGKTATAEIKTTDTPPQRGRRGGGGGGNGGGGGGGK